MSALKAKAASLRRTQQPAKEIQENGPRLATIQRPDGSETRLNMSEFEGHRFLNIQQWRNGRPLLDRRITVGLAGLPDFALGVERALELALETEPQPALPLEQKPKHKTPMPPDDSLDDVLPLN